MTLSARHERRTRRPRLTDGTRPDDNGVLRTCPKCRCTVRVYAAMSASLSPRPGVVTFTAEEFEADRWLSTCGDCSTPKDAQ